MNECCADVDIGFSLINSTRRKMIRSMNVIATITFDTAMRVAMCDAADCQRTAHSFGIDYEANHKTLILNDVEQYLHYIDQDTDTSRDEHNIGLNLEIILYDSFSCHIAKNSGHNPDHQNRS